MTIVDNGEKIMDQKANEMSAKKKVQKNAKLRKICQYCLSSHIKWCSVVIGNGFFTLDSDSNCGYTRGVLCGQHNPLWCQQENLSFKLQQIKLRRLRGDWGIATLSQSAAFHCTTPASTITRVCFLPWFQKVPTKNYEDSLPWLLKSA